MIGRTLRHYRIEEKLGEGGMGAVYRALDTRLDRTVALKVLPPAAVANPERRKRFMQEARTASALKHPNIVMIHDIDEDTSGGEQVYFIAMEFVAGETLDRKIAGRGLPVREALGIAAQVAAGLAAAHTAGVIHRDLKPSNVMVDAEGSVKILDFGLARFDPVLGVDAHGATESFQADLTEVGTILGTVAYMSPEQAEGKRLDSRTDVFSFGSLLYEMLTGRQAFPGDTKVSSLSAVLLKEPPPVAGAVPAIPPEVDRLLKRCLRKDPARRWQSLGDVRLAIEEILDDIESGRTAEPVAATAKVSLGWWKWALLAAVGSGAMAVSYGVFRFIPNRTLTFQRLTFQRGNVYTARFAPGGAVVYSAGWDAGPPTIFSVQPGSREARQFDLPNGKVYSISSKGEMAILLGKGLAGTPATLARAPYSGGAPREVLENVVAAGWGPDGESMAVARRHDGKFRVEYPVGTVILERQQTLGAPFVVPSRDGTRLALTDYRAEVGDFAFLVAEAGRVRTLSSGWRAVGGMAWSPKGDEIWFSAMRLGEEPSIWAVNMSGKERRIGQVAGWPLLQDVSADGDALVSVVNSRVGVLAKVPPPGPAELGWLDASLVYDLAADASAAVFVELSYGEGRNSAIYIRKTDGSAAVRLGFGNRPALSPDRKQVACVRWEGSSSRLMLLPTGAGESKTFPEEGIQHQGVEWFPDGSRILYSGDAPGQPIRSFVQPVAGGSPVAITEPGARALLISPDGRNVLILSGGKYAIRSLDGGPSRPITGIQPGETPVRWSGDGKRLLLRGASGVNLILARLDPNTGAREVLHQLVPPEPGSGFLTGLSVTPDGKWYAVSYQRDLATLFLMKGLR
jgi:tRNA A-37 threonylcarbamoyl transferase component Bud32